jgi:hypothetical protein
LACYKTQNGRKKTNFGKKNLSTKIYPFSSPIKVKEILSLSSHRRFFLSSIDVAKREESPIERDVCAMEEKKKEKEKKIFE